MAFPLLATKFYIPTSGPERLNRPRLLARLDEGLQPGRPLILVSAPAGYGKTTLLAEWAAARGAVAQFAWLSLESAENDPVRFFTYLAAALDKALPGARALIEDLLAAPAPPAPLDLAAALINPLAGSPRPLVIVLDDAQTLSAQELHAALGFLVEHLPPHAHLALATRSDPPLPLHRLRARGQLVELRLSDLRFDRRETAQLLRAEIEAGLSDEQVGLLEERTEGWPAGLRMALLSMRGKDDPGAVLQHLSGGQRFILDYLAEEVLRAQSEEVQAFLLCTSILERFSAELCDAVIENGESRNESRNDSRFSTLDSRVILDYLDRSNLFLIPLDEERTWYRYHHLFADLLRVRLKQRAQGQPGLIEGLHARAAAWLAERQYSEEAVQHSLRAGDFDAAARIVESSTLELLSRGRLHQLLSWTRLLPEELAARRPWLNVAQAWALAFAAQLPEAAARLAQVEASLAAGEVPAEEQARLRAEINAMRSLAAVSGGSYAAAVSVLDQPEESVPPEAGFARSVQRWAVGYARRMRGDLPEAAACFEEVLRIGYELDNLWTIVTASVDLGAVLRQRGELARAESVYRAGLARATQSAGGPGFTGRLEAFLANLLLERDQLDEAGELIERAIEHNRRWVNPNHCAYAWMVRARLDLLRRQPERAAAALAEVDACAASGPLVPPLAAAIDAARLRLWIVRGELAQANAWLERQRFADPPEQARMSELEIVQRLNAARVRLAAGDRSGAGELLAALETAARRGGQIAPLVEARVLQALAAADVSTAVEPLREALTLGLPRGFRQAFLEDGARLIEPLERCQDLPGVSELLARLREQSAASVQPAGSGPLTAREVEILRWVASGLSNPEIGARLYISAGTVKAHTAAIYRKLDVANRAEAIAKAKDLGLL